MAVNISFIANIMTFRVSVGKARRREAADLRGGKLFRGVTATPALPAISDRWPIEQPANFRNARLNLDIDQTFIHPSRCASPS
ncbi:hypothetical protein NKH52_32895 [Mesorhizobium sp. M1066]|uniref:hypothetical protein n=1 Tax=unclassified Mesorhizobium TaxID=325217 RepID=UPI00333AE96A